MVSQTRPLNSVQKIPYKSVNGTATTFGTTPQVIYTVPAGKKAYIIQATTQFVAFGTGTKGRSNYGAIPGREASAADANPVVDIAGINTVLTATQTITFSGNAAGNNETVNYNFTIQETPA